MYHRYGRHGPEAWIRRRKQRLERFTRALVRADRDRVTVIHIHLKFANRERIIVVGLNEDGIQSSEFLDVVEANLSTDALLSPQVDLFGNWKLNAEQEAFTRLTEDFNNSGLPSTEQRLRKHSYDTGYKHLKEYFKTVESTGGKKPPELLDIYVTAFMEAYQTYLKELVGSEVLPDEITIKVEKKAREDRDLDGALDKSLSDLQLKYQAAIRVSELLRLDTRNDTDYLDQVEKFAGIYLDAYANSEEVRRGQAYPSNGFRERYSE